MRLVSFSAGGDRRLGVLDGPSVRDVTEATGAGDVGELLAAGRAVPADGGSLHDLRAVTIHAPIARPGKIICVGLNYHDHCREQGIEPPSYPLLFSKFANAVADPDAAITRPVATEQLDLECELAVVIRTHASRIGREEAAAAIFGYTILNDITMRDLQKEDRQWLRAKGSDRFAPMGPAVVTIDEMPDPQCIGLRSSVNGETWQDSTTAEMIFDVPTIVAFASRTITLEPGDVIATGTPAGVGHYQSPPRYLADGDHLRCEIDGIGVLENFVVDERPRIADHGDAAGVGGATPAPSG